MISGLLTFTIIVLCVAVVAYMYRCIRNETFVPSAGVRFMTADETAIFIMQDPDGYVKNMSPTDLYARKTSSPEQYISRCAKVAKEFSSAQKIRFTKACKDADDFFRSLNDTYIDSDKMIKIPWVLAMTEGETYEDGLPHTRANIIFVSSFMNEQSNELVRTMIHEKLHLYQRLYPEEIVHMIYAKGFKQWKLRMGEPRIRANPDVDPWIYMNPENNEPMMAVYTSDRPSNISDVFLKDYTFEHPYEYVAYEIASKYGSK